MYNQCNLFSETYMDVSQQQDGLSEISSDESGKKLNDKYQTFLIKCIVICVLKAPECSE